MNEHIFEQLQKWSKTKFVNLRYFNPAGSMPEAGLGKNHEPETHLIPNLIQSILQEELKRFLKELKVNTSPQFYALALTQFCLGLRIGEACGLHWDAIDLEKKTAKIEWTIEWDFVTWEATTFTFPRQKWHSVTSRLNTLFISFAQDILDFVFSGVSGISDPVSAFPFFSSFNFPFTILLQCAARLKTLAASIKK